MALDQKASEMCEDLEAALAADGHLGVSFNAHVRRHVDEPDDTPNVARLSREKCGALVTAHREAFDQNQVEEDDIADASSSLNPSGSGPAAGDSELAGLRELCADGDMRACDDLYMESPWGSDLEAFGATCGERREDRSEGAFCEDVFGSDDREPHPLTDEETFLVLQLAWERLTALERRTMCDEVAKGDSATVAAGSEIAEASGGVVTTVEAAAFLRTVC